MIQCPDAFAGAAKSAIEVAISDADRDWKEHRNAVAFVQDIYATLVRELLRIATPETIDELRSAADDFLNELVHEAYKNKTRASERQGQEQFRHACDRTLALITVQLAYALPRSSGTARTPHQKPPLGTTDVSKAARQRDSPSLKQLKCRAEWLESQLAARDAMTPHRLHKIGGPHRKTTHKVLAGKDVGSDVWRRIVRALSKEGPQVRFEDVP